MAGCGVPSPLLHIEKEKKTAGTLALCSHFTYHSFRDENGTENNEFVTNYLKIFDLTSGELVDCIRMKVKGTPFWQKIEGILVDHGYDSDMFFCMWYADFEKDGTLNDCRIDLLEVPVFGSVAA